ncbi:MULTISPECIES: LysR family transcriptional regulator [Prauserella salsuginis group]|uniref:DNA-binding transcriptional LysR family regulator n=2 Tax=Prauserella salsuginis group TaxID=2893672 RepID=A0A839XV57_9PSEU|nr:MULTISPECIES: LysR family transcriptional regulator [Prauserella salsuginis group]MBB3663886.1 DNA-binding transcriptional LysR family regulator [Prauserella sediminis]MCR3718050.1 DNA-binding transcriptional regulator, LysR family [Prauserella flava]MCR3732617.1 DNA-binding transcriptional regulator, LysR family [Prauserella salsuginis]
MVLPSKMPQLADLDLLLSVEDYGSVGKAAQAHSLSQPAASIRLSAMERRLGIRLLERSPTGSKLTEDGKTLAEYARNVMYAARELLEFGSGSSLSETKRLRLASSPGISENLIPEWLSRGGAAFGDVRVEVQTGKVDTLRQLVHANHVDLAFIDGWCEAGGLVPKQSREDLITQYICDDRLAVVVGSGHPWATRPGPAAVQELADAQLVVRERGSAIREFTEELLGAARGPRNYLEFPSNGAIKHAIAAGQRAAVLNVSTVRSELADGRLHWVPLDRDMPAKPIHAVWSKTRPLPGYARELVEIAAKKGSPLRPVDGVSELGSNVIAEADAARTMFLRSQSMETMT